MDLCTWDVGAIGSILGAVATLIAAGVALYIFTQWKNQKASEVVANEAKYAINELFEINRIFLELVNFHFDNSNELRGKLINFISASYNTLAKLTFIQNTILDKDGSIEESIAEFHKITVELITIFTTNLDRENVDIVSFRARIAIMKIDQNNEIELFRRHSIKVIENCKNIAMYKIKVQ